MRNGKGENMSAKGKSRRSFLIHSVGGLNAAWVAAHYHDILAAQEFANKTGQPPALVVFTNAIRCDAIFEISRT